MNKNILIKPDKSDDKTKSGLYIPSEGQKTEYGTVEAVSHDSNDFKVGDRIFYKEYTTNNIEDLFLIKEDDILAVIE